MPKLQATITGLVQTPEYNGNGCTLLSWTLVNHNVRINVVTQHGMRLSVSLKNLTFSNKHAEAVVISAISKKMQPVIAINVCAANPKHFYTELGLAALTGSDFTLQRFMDSTHVLALACNKHVVEPRWNEVKQSLLLKSAEVLWFHNLRRLACEYAEHVLVSDPDNIRARLIVKQ